MSTVQRNGKQKEVATKTSDTQKTHISNKPEDIKKNQLEICRTENYSQWDEKEASLGLVTGTAEKARGGMWTGGWASMDDPIGTT